MYNQLYKGYEIKISTDDHPLDPRKEWDNLGTIYGSWGEKPFSEIEVNDNWVDTKNHLDEHFIWLPIYGYSHGGRTVKTTPFNCQWDSGLMGVIAVAKQKVREDYSVKRISPQKKQKVEKCLLGEVETFDYWLTGNVWGYEIYKDGQLIDSCWGYFGDWDNEEYSALTEAKSVVDFHVSNAIKTHIHNVKNWIKNKVPHIYRTNLSI